MKIKHLEESGMNYFEHQHRAFKFAVWSFQMYFVCIIHALFPWLFTDTFSNSVLELAKNLEGEENEEY
jgi:hypothetical protein